MSLIICNSMTLTVQHWQWFLSLQQVLHYFLFEKVKNKKAQPTEPIPTYARFWPFSCAYEANEKKKKISGMCKIQSIISWKDAFASCMEECQNMSLLGRLNGWLPDWMAGCLDGWRLGRFTGRQWSPCLHYCLFV